MDIRIIYTLIYSAMLILAGILIFWYFIKDTLYDLKRFKKQAVVDPLTGKLNRYAFNNEVDKKIKKENEKPAETKEDFALCFFDLDGFKQINDNIGHDAGDILLIKLAEILDATLPENCKSYRLGGDEFAIYIEDINNKRQVESILKKLQKEVAKPIKIGENIIILEYSIGVAMYPKDGQDRQTLLKCADIAMYSVKESGKNGVAFHAASLKKKYENKYKMEQMILNSYKENLFEVEYQPRFLNKGKDKETLWLEAKVFWKHPSLGRLKSAYFMKYVEEMGLVIDFDEFILRSVCKTLKEYNEKGYKKVNFALNISLKHFKRTDFINRICDIIEEEGVLEIADRLSFEINSRMEFVNLDKYKLLMDRLREYGIHIVVNNLEISYESIIQLRQLPIDEIKINCEYIKQEIINSEVFSSVVDLIKKLNYQTIVVGIEEQSEYDMAIKSKAEKIQGNYLSKSLSIKELESYVEKILKK